MGSVSVDVDGGSLFSPLGDGGVSVSVASSGGSMS